MRLLDTESLQSAILHSGVTLDLDIHDFYGQLWGLIKAAENVERDADMLPLEKELRHVFREYYRQTGAWLFERDVALADQTVDPAWRYQAMKGRDQLIAFQKQMQRYVLCYMHLNRALVRTRIDIEKIAKLYPHDENRHGIRISDVTGMLVARAFRQKKEMMQKRQRLTALSGVLQEMQDCFTLLRGDLLLQMPAAERAYTAFQAALRQGEFDIAYTMVREWTDGTHIANPAAQKMIAANADRILTLVTAHAAGLKVQGGYMLEKSDIALLFSFQKAEEARVDSFLRKYMLPLLTYKLRQLLGVAGRLGRIGSLEGLLVVHARLLGGLARPMDDIAQIKRFEEDVVAKASFLVRHAFPDLPHIFNETEVIYDQLRVFIAGTHAVGPGIEVPRTL